MAIAHKQALLLARPYSKIRDPIFVPHLAATVGVMVRKSVRGDGQDVAAAAWWLRVFRTVVDSTP